MRWAVGIITFFFVISAIFLYFVDVKQGYIEALNFHMTAEVELVEAKLKDPSIRVEEEDLSPEELEKRAIETRAIIAKVSKQDLDQPGVLTSAKTKIGALKADDDIVEQHLDLSKEPADLFTPRESEPTPPAEEAPMASDVEREPDEAPAAAVSDEEHEPDEPPPRIKKKSKTNLDLDGNGTGTKKRKKKSKQDLNAPNDVDEQERRSE
jgi:hypothetical protein